MILVQNPRNLSHKTEDGRIFSETKVLSGSFPAQFYVAVFRVTRTCREETGRDKEMYYKQRTPVNFLVFALVYKYIPD